MRFSVQRFTSPVQYVRFPGDETEIAYWYVASTTDAQGNTHGVDTVDNEALRSARLSKYSPGMAFCKPVPGTYLYHVVLGSET